MTKSTISTLILFLLLIFSISFYFLANGSDKGVEVFCLFLLAIALITYFFSSKRSFELRGNTFRPSLFLLFGLVIIGCQNIIDLLLGYMQESNVVFISPKIVDKGFAFAISGIISFLLGYVITTNGLKARPDGDRFVSIKLLNYGAAAFFILFVLSLDSSFFSGEDYIESGIIAKSTTNNSEFVLGVLFASVIIQYSINRKGYMTFRQYIFGFPKLFLVVFFSYLVLRFISGARASVLRNVLLLFFSYSFVCRKQPFKTSTIIVFLIVGVVLFSALSFSRGLVGNSFSERYSYGLEHLKNNGSISPPTQELAHSQICNQLIIKELQEKPNSMSYGGNQLRYFIVLFVPNRILNMIWPMPLERQGSAYFLTVQYLGRNATSGLGTTLWADFFLDFGFIGMLLCMGIVGGLFKKIDMLIFSKDKMYSTFSTVMALSLGSSSLYLSRSAFIPLLRLPLYVFIVLIINRSLFRQKGARA